MNFKMILEPNWEENLRRLHKNTVKDGGDNLLWQKELKSTLNKRIKEIYSLIKQGIAIEK